MEGVMEDEDDWRLGVAFDEPAIDAVARAMRAASETPRLAPRVRDVQPWVHGSYAWATIW